MPLRERHRTCSGMSIGQAVASSGARLGRSLRAIGVFVGLVGAFYALIHTPAAEGAFFRPYLAALARITGGLVSLLGFGNGVVETTIYADEFSMEIVRGCDAIEPVAAFAAAVIASPARIWTKISGILVGTAALLVINLVRLVSLFFVGVYRPEWFDVAHEQIWQAAFVILTIAAWAVWMQWAGKRSGPPAVGPV